MELVFVKEDLSNSLFLKFKKKEKKKRIYTSNNKIVYLR
jgi:hypothetical protein